MRAHTVSISEIIRQTLIATAALLACASSVTSTILYFSQIDPGTAWGLMVAIGIVLEVAKVGFALTAACYWHQGYWVKSGAFWLISIALSAGGVIATHGLVSTSDIQGIGQRVEASREYKDLEHDVGIAKERLNALVAVMKKDIGRDRDTRGLETEKRLDGAEAKYREARDRLSAYHAEAMASDDASRGTSMSWRQTWRWLVPIMLEVIGQLAMVELMASCRAMPSATAHIQCIPGPKAPGPTSQRLRLVPKRLARSAYDEAEQLVRDGLPATHAHLMGALDCSRSTVQRILKRLRHKGLVKLDGNRNVRAA